MKSKSILVIGGTRFFGRDLVRRLIEAGHRVSIATRGRAGDDFGDAVRRLRVDRRDEAALRAAVAGRDYDLVYDQMCYSPLDAAISCRVFDGRVGRYLMASTIEVYEALRGRLRRPLRETDLDLSAEPLQTDYPWHEPDCPPQAYGRGKRQAEAWLARQARFPVVAVRIGHVLAGPEDFTGRLAHYLRRAEGTRPFHHAARPGRSSFLTAAEIARFLDWAGAQDFSGPVNAACQGGLSALDLYQAAAGPQSPPVRPVAGPLAAAELSPFDYPCPYEMDTARAEALGFRFAAIAPLLPGLLDSHRRAAGPGLDTPAPPAPPQADSRLDPAELAS